MTGPLPNSVPLGRPYHHVALGVFLSVSFFAAVFLPQIGPDMESVSAPANSPSKASLPELELPPLNLGSLPRESPSAEGEYSELEGLRASAKFLGWNEEGKALLQYSLVFQSPIHLWMLDNYETIYITCWDVAGASLGPTIVERVRLGQAFLTGKVKSVNVTLAISVLKKTRFVAIALGRSGLVTKKIPIPSGKEKGKTGKRGSVERHVLGP